MSPLSCLPAPSPQRAMLVSALPFDLPRALTRAGAALPGPDPLGNGVPIPSGERGAALSNARRD
jgi:hypothetical protein